MKQTARQNFIHEEAKKIREKLNIEMNTPDSFFMVKEILDRYDNQRKFSQHDVSNRSELLIKFLKWLYNDEEEFTDGDNAMITTFLNELSKDRFSKNL